MHSNAILALLACTHPLRLSDHKRNPEKEGAVALNRIDTVILKNSLKMAASPPFLLARAPQ